jgi:hypothetical protein
MAILRPIAQLIPKAKNISLREKKKNKQSFKQKSFSKSYILPAKLPEIIKNFAFS